MRLYPNSIKQTDMVDQMDSQHVLKLDSQGRSPWLPDMENVADSLPVKRYEPIGRQEFPWLVRQTSTRVQS